MPLRVRARPARSSGVPPSPIAPGPPLCQATRYLSRGLHGVWSAEHVAGLGNPCRPLLGQAAWFVFGFPGFQGGLLGQLQRLHRSGWAAVGLLEMGCEHGPPGFDAGSTRRPPGIQGRVDADDFP